MRVLSLGQKDPLEKEKATHSSILAWEIPWREETGWLQSTELQKVQSNSETEQQHPTYYHFEVLFKKIDMTKIIYLAPSMCLYTSYYKFHGIFTLNQRIYFLQL